MINIALGTAQFGQEYGICNKSEIINSDSAKNIINVALNNKILTFDTANLYGDSERILGDALQSYTEQSNIKVITKYHVDSSNIEKLKIDIENSIENIHPNYIYGALIHNTAPLLEKNGKQIWNEFKALKKRFKIPKIGVSVYTPQEFLDITRRYETEIIQVPCNLLDQRFLNEDIEKVKKNRNIEIHARSLFLQGLLLQATQNLPSIFKENKNAFKKIEAFNKEYKLTPLETCLLYANFVQKRNMVDFWVIGADNEKQLKDIIDTHKIIEQKQPLMDIDFAQFKTNDESIIDPRDWQIER
jgi:aryl-alcohol dehydrogenase-like predicted oxidoreductase